ncbi:YhcN/YlaJ family sporulation lipoprotein [Paenibacillus sp. NAIST15-1]|uniref:YhcN/YlaJ family sporulation lipoprotein n=1 Tax=Paenibacillus sp. NAIST15-1 TaxID=1605994 RepID=UPI00086A15D4|nr:YhcN/YlaJ family sporulation lipoprotein [Paenibacillus sp. NAIST15-1]GAV15449.1 hypothetical protein PBN151_5429 [Paenibacillus sp. NAIST15-1]
MRAKAVLLTLTAALVMTMGLTGCGNRDNMSTKSVRQHNMNYGNDGVRPLGTDHRYNANRYNTNFSGDGLRSYNMNQFSPDGYTRGYGYDGGYRTNNFNNGTYGQYGTYGYNGSYGNNGTYGNNAYGGRYGTHSANKLEMNQKLAKKIASIKGVKSAHVMMTNNNNAYVAVVTDHTSKGVHSKSVKPGHGPRPYSAGSLGSYDGTSNVNDNISGDLKAHIANAVKKEDPSCNNVYVSANPDFVNRMNEYSKQVGAGHPIAGFANEFSEMVYRLFPTNVTNQSYNHPTRLHNMAPGTGTTGTR